MRTYKSITTSELGTSQSCNISWMLNVHSKCRLCEIFGLVCHYTSSRGKTFVVDKGRVPVIFERNKEDCMLWIWIKKRIRETMAYYIVCMPTWTKVHLHQLNNTFIGCYIVCAPIWINVHPLHLKHIHTTYNSLVPSILGLSRIPRR